MQRNRTRSWLGVNWMRHTGLPGKGTASAVCFTYHKNALGHGSGADVTSDITWHGDRAAHFVNNMMSQGACLIDPEGVIEIRVDDTATIPRSEEHTSELQSQMRIPYAVLCLQQ